MHRARVLWAFCALACSILPAVVAFAQETPVAAQEAKEEVRPNSLYPGSWSLQFQITEDIGLKPFNGMIVSVKRHFSERSALRLGVRFDFDWSDESNMGRAEQQDSLIDWYDMDEHNEFQRFTMDLSYLNYPSPGSYVNLFWGIGPLVSYSRSESSSSETDPYDDAYSRYDCARSWEIGALGLIGVEWFLVKHFSFHSEYRASVSYGQGYREIVRTMTTNTMRRVTERSETDGWAIDGYVILGLSVYF